VRFIKAQSYLEFESAPAGAPAGFFKCTSVSQPADVSYDGCVGELLCTCPRASNAQHICKHLDAATDVQPLTHAKRKAAARALLEMPVDCFVEVAERGGVLICRQVQCIADRLY
jgi:hypothetical protein